MKNRKKEKAIQKKEIFGLISGSSYSGSGGGAKFIKCQGHTVSGIICRW